jgi:hypothetical protein
MEMLDHMSVLRTFLDAQGTGPVVDGKGLIAHLGPVWPTLAGAGDETMEPWKLGRMENPVWQPPVLTFVIERHGGSALESTHASLQAWTIDLNWVTAIPATIGYREGLARPAPLRVASLVAEIVRLVVNGLDDRRLKWSIDRQTVDIAVGEIILDDGPKVTVAGRKRRFRVRLKREMAAAGWTKTGPATFTRVQAEAE